MGRFIDSVLFCQVSYTFARVYSCLGLGLYSLQILSRVPHVPWADIQTMLAEVCTLCLHYNPSPEKDLM